MFYIRTCWYVYCCLDSCLNFVQWALNNPTLHGPQHRCQIIQYFLVCIVIPVNLPSEMVTLEGMLDYGDVRMQSFHCTIVL